MKALIVDDEPLARMRVQRLLSAISEYSVFEQACNGQEALAIAANFVPDIVFLDVDMPQMNGLEVAEKLNELSVPPAVVFITAHPEHALDALQLSAAGYLVKPVTKDSVEKVTAQLGRVNRAHLQAQKAKSISYQSSGIIKTVQLHDVYFLSAEDKYTRIVFNEGEALIDQSLKQIEQEFPAFFLRTHRKILVNKERIVALKTYCDGSHKVQVDGCTEELVVSRREYKRVKSFLS
ncbi:LytR/AlgR family response regulator transcription factor [Pseudoalteromonas sp. H105]|uniref:LytR/AlgR family response regulator transcription factor n=1 Tax=Pseudoalteromonas sp. H105 TaxID=1348393 RepID=UPI0007320005|nr:LytTR family DNA-binding domain-containing protein [Pseudoalteromonas sp. H105]KTF16311.1 two-component system response regulator [Pseudoalteromonas sp. H105]